MGPQPASISAVMLADPVTALAIGLLLAGAPSAGAVTITEHVLPGAAAATGITSSGGSLWAAAPGQILRIAPDASAQPFTGGGVATTVPFAIAPGPVGDTKVWFVEQDDDGNGTVGSVTPAGVITRYPDEVTESPGLADITPGGTVVWFTESLLDAIGRIRVTDNTVNEFDDGINNGVPSGIAVGADGNVWFTEQDSPGAIARYVPATQVVTEFSAGLTPDAEPGDIVAGPAGALYFTLAGAIGRITTTGAISEFRTGITPGALPQQLTVGPDGAIWFTEANDRIGRLDPVSGIVTEYGAGISAGGRPEGITTGPDGALWFTLPGTGKVGRLSLQDPTVPPEPTPTPSPTTTPTPAPTTAPPPAPAPIAAPRRALSLRAPSRVRGTARRAVRIPFRLNRRAVVRVVVRRAGHRRATRRVNGRAGRNLVLVGPLAPGRWTARLSARAADGRRDRDSVAIVVRAAAAPAPRFTG
jgi:virginiamycin B lyase